MTITIHKAALKDLDLPMLTRRTVEQTVTSWTQTPSLPLHSVYVYGSAARGEWHKKISDLNVLLLFNNLSFDHLDALGDPMHTAIHKKNVTPFILTQSELQASTDVYCVKFDDIRRFHVCVAGDNIVQDLSIDAEHTRFVCEFDLRNLALRLRMFFLRNHKHKTYERAALMNFFSSSMFPLRSLLGLLGHEPPASTPEVIQALGTHLNVQTNALQSLWDLHRNPRKTTHDELVPLFNQFSAVLHQAIGRVDSL